MMQKLNLELKGNSNRHAFFLLMEDITLDSCKNVIEWIFEANFSEEAPDMLNLIVCSPGGDAFAALSLVDVMKGSHIPIRTIGLGQIASAGLIIFMAGKKGHRILTPNTSILSHQYTWGSFGKEHELFAQVREFELMTDRISQHYKRCTGLSENKIREVLLPPHDVWLSAQEAKKLGICDEVKDLK